MNLTIGEVGNDPSFFGCGYRSPRLEELCRSLSKPAREACSLGHSRLERFGIIGTEYRFFKKVRSSSSVECPRWRCLLECWLFERKIGVEIGLCGSTDSCPSQSAMTARSMAACSNSIAALGRSTCGVTRLFFSVVHVCCATTTYFETRYWTESELSRPPQPYGNRSERSFDCS